MAPDSNQVVYACISREAMVLADFSSGDSDLETLARQCLERTPQFHHLFSHTIRKRIYCFLIEDPFVYFVILDEGFGKSQGLRFLERLKASFQSFLKRRPIESTDQWSLRCFQEEYSPVLRFLMHLSAEEDEALDSDSSTGKDSGGTEAPLIGNEKAHEHDRKKKSVLKGEENGYDRANNMSNGTVNENRELSPSLLKNGCSVDDEFKKAERVWWQQTCIILLLDVVVCCILFAVWLTICDGFRCMGG